MSPVTVAKGAVVPTFLYQVRDDMMTRPTDVQTMFDDIPITAIMTMETVGTGTRYVFTALHRDEADLETNRTSGFYEGTEIAVDQFVEHVIAMK